MAFRNRRAGRKESSSKGSSRSPMLEHLEPRLLLDGAVGETAIELFSASTALFVENQGQWSDESVRYAFRGDGANVLFTDAGPVFQVFKREPIDDTDADGDDFPAGVGAPTDDPFGEREDFITHSTQFSVHFDGSDTVTPVGLQESDSKFNYFIGDQADWRAGVSAYEVVAYENLYDGIDLHTWGRRNSLKYEFHVAPGADYAQIQVSYEGIEGLYLSADGALHVQTELGELIDDAPYVYQVIDGKQVEVAGSFEIIDGDSYTFSITGGYEAGVELIIDPYLSWSTYMGGSDRDWGSDIAVDGSGGVYVTGCTYSSGWASGGFDTSHDGYSDIFVARLSTSGGHAWSTYMGGSDYDYGYGIAVDGFGSVYVTGVTASSGWASGGFDTSYNGGADVFVARLTPSGSHAWSTYMGGSSPESGHGIAVDSSGGVYVTGGTESSGWVSGGFDTSHDGYSDIFVARLSTSGGHAWSTYMGGSDYDYGYGIAVNGSGGVYVTGGTGSGGWVSGGFDTSYNGDEDIFVARLSTSGGHAWSTYMGGSDRDWGSDIAVDGSDGMYVT